MSGFIGIFNSDGCPVEADLLQRMTQLLAQQAPDEQDTWQDGAVGLGHALLRTTWESENEHQPCTLDGGVWITGDIRLDRRDGLISQLRSAGCHVKGAEADVDLVLHAYQIWEQACLDRITGDFAFAIWDRRQQTLFCARDQFGVVPLYYADLGNSLLVSNNINCLRSHPQVSETLNDHAIGDFLLFGMNMDFTTTTFVDIQKLPPAHTLTRTPSRQKIQRYWQLPEDVDYLRYRNPQDYVEQFRELFDQSVADRLRTDRAGTHLSGGLDSTSIAATAYPMMQAMGTGEVDFRAYAIVYKYLADEEEGKYAAQVAKMAGFPLEYLVAEDFIEQAPEEHPTYIPAEPLMIPNQVAEVEISRRTTSFSRVLFAGFGGDPCLYPASDYFSKLWQQRQFNHLAGDVLTSLQIQHRLPRVGLRSTVRQLLKKEQSTVPALHLPDWINSDFTNHVDLEARWQDYFAVPPQKARYGMLSGALWSNIFAYSAPGFTGHPLKVRFPFFDVELVSFLLSIPSTPWFESKLLLRAAMQGRLPESVRWRPKKPLGKSPHFKLMQQRGCVPWMDSLAIAPSLNRYVNGDDLIKSLNNLDSFNQPDYIRAMSVFSLAYWLNQKVKLPAIKAHMN